MNSEYLHLSGSINGYNKNNKRQFPTFQCKQLCISGYIDTNNSSIFKRELFPSLEKIYLTPLDTWEITFMNLSESFPDAKIFIRGDVDETLTYQYSPIHDMSLNKKRSLIGTTKYPNVITMTEDMSDLVKHIFGQDKWLLYQLLEKQPLTFSNIT